MPYHGPMQQKHKATYRNLTVNWLAHRSLSLSMYVHHHASKCVFRKCLTSFTLKFDGLLTFDWKAPQVWRKTWHIQPALLRFCIASRERSHAAPLQTNEIRFSHCGTLGKAVHLREGSPASLALPPIGPFRNMEANNSLQQPFGSRCVSVMSCEECAICRSEI